MDRDQLRKIFIINGQVQGVGFRPFIWKLAAGLDLAGNIRNTSFGVRIDIQGDGGKLHEFERRLKAEQPPLARITNVEVRDAPLQECLNGFEILESVGHAGQNVLIGADVAVCDDCLADIRDPSNPRFGYAFANCTNCGPRYSITRQIPYDRASTSMACFAMCARCAAEYKNPADRRFHAQPVACPQCGPRVWFVDEANIKAGNTMPDTHNSEDAIACLGSALLEGKIAALRGLGGFQLVCDARNDAAVALLRQRKSRPHKALAVMAADIDSVRGFCRLSPDHERLLCGRQKPVVLCPSLPAANEPVSPLVAPDTDTVGVMLPYTPLHALLMDWLGRHGMEHPVLVMTSGNPAGSPICLGNREALDRLACMADVFLLHDRDILCRVDDSVVAVENGVPVFLRRARGYVPEPYPLPAAGPSVFGAGAMLKATFCLTRGVQAFSGQHIGDLESLEEMDFYEQSLEHMQRLLEVEPEAVVHDLHPDFMSSHFALSLAADRGIPAFALQHHVAHAAACLAENACFEPALAICLDGTGLGTDGSIWGGEVLWLDLSRPEWRRMGGLSGFILPGGDAAIRQPWRIAASLGRGRKKPEERDRKIYEMLEKGINCVPCSSAGRLFDGVAAFLGLCDEITYEGQAAIRLEKCAAGWLAQNGAPQSATPVLAEKHGKLFLDSEALFRLLDPQAPGKSAAAFHYAFARGFAALAVNMADKEGVKKVALSGGVMHNAIIAAILPRYLSEAGLEPLRHRLTPPGDGGISYGQAVWGRQLIAAGVPEQQESASYG